MIEWLIVLELFGFRRVVLGIIYDKKLVHSPRALLFKELCKSLKQQQHNASIKFLSIKLNVQLISA